MHLQDHVVEALEAVDRKKFDVALMHACISIEASARNHFRQRRAGKKDYKDFVRKYYWIIQFMSASAFDMTKTKFNNLKLFDQNNKPIYDPEFADIVYHIYRCTHAHGDALPSEFELVDYGDSFTTWDMAADLLRLPKRIVFGLLAAAVFARCNAQVQSTGEAFLSWGAPMIGIPTKCWRIRDSWGKEDDFRLFVDQNPTTVVEILHLERLRESVGLDSHIPRSLKT